MVTVGVKSHLTWWVTKDRIYSQSTPDIRLGMPNPDRAQTVQGANVWGQGSDQKVSLPVCLGHSPGTGAYH